MLTPSEHFKHDSEIFKQLRKKSWDFANASYAISPLAATILNHMADLHRAFSPNSLVYTGRELAVAVIKFASHVINKDESTTVQVWVILFFLSSFEFIMWTFLGFVHQYFLLPCRSLFRDTSKSSCATRWLLVMISKVGTKVAAAPHSSLFHPFPELFHRISRKNSLAGKREAVMRKLKESNVAKRKAQTPTQQKTLMVSHGGWDAVLQKRLAGLCLFVVMNPCVFSQRSWFGLLF